MGIAWHVRRIVSAVSPLPGQRPRVDFLLAYNAGRIASYTAAGALAGAIGASGFFMQHVLPVEQLLYALASVMLVVLGLYLAGLWQGVLVLERLGGVLWKHIQPVSRHFLPMRSLPRALALGAVMGWLPCGLVYSVLVAALATGSVAQGALLMLAFGLGTLPTLMAMGLAAARLKNFLQHIWVAWCRLAGDGVRRARVVAGDVDQLLAGFCQVPQRYMARLPSRLGMKCTVSPSVMTLRSLIVMP